MRLVMFASVLVLVGLGSLIAVGIAPQPDTGKHSAEKLGPLSREEYRFARLITSYELMRRHMAECVSEPFLADLQEQQNRLQKNRDFSEALSQMLLDEAELGASWKAKFIPNKMDEKLPLSEFEKRAIARLDQGDEEVGERTSAKTVLYIRSVRAQQSCVSTCHRPPPSDRSLKAGDTMGRMSVEATFRAGVSKKSTLGNGSQPK